MLIFFLKGKQLTNLGNEGRYVLLLLPKVLFDLVDAGNAVVYVFCLPVVAVVLAVQHVYLVLQGRFVVLTLLKFLKDVVQFQGGFVV
jgi:hypothetical protein